MGTEQQDLITVSQNEGEALVTGQEVTCRTFSLPHGQQAVLVAVAERTLGDRLEVPGVNSAAGNGVAALTHAGVVTQATFVQVRVGQSVAAGDPFSLEMNADRRVETR